MVTCWPSQLRARTNSACHRITTERASLLWFGWKRKKAVLLCAGALVIIAIPSALSYTDIGLTIGGKPFLDAMDFAFGTVLAPLSALAMCIGIAWFWKESDFITELNLNTHHMIGSAIVVLLKHVIPLALMLLFLAFVFGRVL